MRRVILMLCAGTVLLVAAAHLYRDPRVRELFRSAPSSASARNRPVRDQGVHAAQTPAPTKASAPREAAPRAAGPDEQHEAAPVRISQTPNDVIARVLLQVLAAKKLGRGISLEVSDDVIRIFGEAQSAEGREAILRLVEKGREARRIDGTGLIVGN